MSRHPIVAALVEDLVGLWAGRGSGGYPTIEDFAYREELRFTARADHPALHFEQRSWKETVEGQEEVSHWETGLVRFSSDGSVRLLNAQGGRTEVLEGSYASTQSGGWGIELSSVAFAGDERVVATRRLIHLGIDILTYDMFMTTRSVGKEHLHLRASLQRIE